MVKNVELKLEFLRNFGGKNVNFWGPNLNKNIAFGGQIIILKT